MEAAIFYAADFGLENVSTKKIAETIPISEGSIFHNFPNKKALLVHCLHYIDSILNEALGSVPSCGTSLYQYMTALWYTYFKFLVSHRNYNKFYLQFCRSSYYKEETRTAPHASYPFFQKIIQNNMRLLGLDPDLIWQYLIDTSRCFALQIADGTLPDTPETYDIVFNLLTHGILPHQERSNHSRSDLSQEVNHSV